MLMIARYFVAVFHDDAFPFADADYFRLISLRLRTLHAAIVYADDVATPIIIRHYDAFLHAMPSLFFHADTALPFRATPYDDVILLHATDY